MLSELSCLLEARSSPRAPGYVDQESRPMARTDTAVVRVPEADANREGAVLGSPIAIVGVALLLLLSLGWALLVHPALSAPTRDPASDTWRANVVLHADPGS